MKDYSKAYVELNGMIAEFSSDLLEKIPKDVIKNIKSNMSSDYIWEYDKSKNPEEQNLMPETKALFVQIYEKYLCPEEEKLRWEKYDQICYNVAEENKKQKYNPDNIFSNDIESIVSDEINENTDEQSMVVYEENFLQNILNRFKEIISKIFKNKSK